MSFDDFVRKDRTNPFATMEKAGRCGRSKNMNNINSIKKELSPKQREELLKTLKVRFEKNMNRHKGLEWVKVQSRICGMEVTAEKLWSLNEMDITRGEPDVVDLDEETGDYIFFD